MQRSSRTFCSCLRAASRASPSNFALKRSRTYSDVPPAGRFPYDGSTSGAASTSSSFSSSPSTSASPSPSASQAKPKLFLHSIPLTQTPETVLKLLTDAGIPASDLSFRPIKATSATGEVLEPPKFRHADCTVENEEGVESALKLPNSELPFLINRGRPTFTPSSSASSSSSDPSSSSASSGDTKAKGYPGQLPSALIPFSPESLSVQDAFRSSLSIEIFKVSRRPNGTSRVLFLTEEDRERALAEKAELPFELVEKLDSSPPPSPSTPALTLEELFPNLLSKGYDPIFSLDPSFKPSPRSSTPRKPLSYKPMLFEFQLPSTAKETLDEEVLSSIPVNESDIEANIPPPREPTVIVAAEAPK